MFTAGSLEYTKLDEKSDFFTFLFIAFVHMWFAISGIDQSWNLTILHSGALLPLKTVCQIPAHSFEFLTWVLYYLPWKSRSSKCLSYFPVGRNIHINYNLSRALWFLVRVKWLELWKWPHDSFVIPIFGSESCTMWIHHTLCY